MMACCSHILSSGYPANFVGWGSYVLSREGAEAQKSLNIYAIYSNNNGDCKTLGRARVLTMPKQKQELILVPVRRAQSTVDSVTIEKQLNSIYQPLGVTYKVHVDEQFGGTYGDKDETYSFLDEGLAVTGSGLFTTETDDMKTLKALYAQDHSIKDSVAYIFILPKATTQDGSSIAVLGDMPRNNQVGYVFSEPTTPYADGLTIAHELGHGLYSFEHTFENNGPTQGSTSNLMDYSNNAQKDLRVWQWNLIYSHKSYTVPFFEADEDGMKVVQLNNTYIDRINRSNIGIRPDGKIIADITSDRYKVVISCSSTSFKIEQFALYNGKEIHSRYCWDKDKKTYCSGNVSVENSQDVTITYSPNPTYAELTQIYHTTSNYCIGKSAEILYNGREIPSTDDWTYHYYINADPECYKLKNENCSKDEINKSLKLLNEIQENTNRSEAIRTVNNSNSCALALLPYTQQIKIIKLISLSTNEELKTEDINAINSLIDAINKQNYTKFFKDLESDGNKLINRFIGEFSQSFTDHKEYDYFISKLISMTKVTYNDYQSSLEDNPIFLQTMDYSKFKITGFDYSYKYRYNCDYDSKSGNLIPYKEELKYNALDIAQQQSNIGSYSSDNLATNSIFFDALYRLLTGEENWKYDINQDKFDDDYTISPLTPCLIPSTQKDFDVTTVALESFAYDDIKYYIVPAIFFKYRNDIKYQEALIKDFWLTVDVASIAMSGGTALAAKIPWIERAWAIADIASSTSDAVLQTNIIDNEEIKTALNYSTLVLDFLGGIHSTKELLKSRYARVKSHDVISPLLKENKDLYTFEAPEGWPFKMVQGEFKNRITKAIEAIKQRGGWPKSIEETDYNFISFIVTQLDEEERLKCIKTIFDNNVFPEESTQWLIKNYSEKKYLRYWDINLRASVTSNVSSEDLKFARGISDKFEKQMEKDNSMLVKVYPKAAESYLFLDGLCIKNTNCVGFKYTYGTKKQSLLNKTNVIGFDFPKEGEIKNDFTKDPSSNYYVGYHIYGKNCPELKLNIEDDCPCTKTGLTIGGIPDCKPVQNINYEIGDYLKEYKSDGTFFCKYLFEITDNCPHGCFNKFNKIYEE